MSTKTRSYENAKVTKVEIKTRVKPDGKRETRTSYEAEYPDGSKLIFYGFNVNKSIFKVQEHDGQMVLSDFMNYPEDYE